jgi:2-phospho-L-lactate guanylyltransferase
MASGDPLERTDPRSKVAVVVPIKAFDEAKERLAGALSDTQRSALAQTMAATVLRAARPLTTFVVCGDETVAGWADEHEAEVLWFPEPGLNPAVAFALSELTDRGFQRVVVAHGDLPKAKELASVVIPSTDDHPETVIVVRDRRGDGTNVLSVPTGTPFRFSYGAGSAAAHEAEAARLGLPLRVVDDDKLGWDVDLPEDLLDDVHGQPAQPGNTEGDLLGGQP